MTKATQLAVVLYMETQVLAELIYQPKEERLSDIINGVSLRWENRGRFVELRDATIERVDGREERLPTTYINKATIQAAATIDGDLAKGIGGRIKVKSYPFVEKLPVLVRVQMPAYILIGNMYCASRQMAWRTLGEKPFLPVTNVSIQKSDNSHWWKLPFATVNRDQYCLWQK